MSLLRKVSDLCCDSPKGINVDELVKLCPEATRKQVIAAAHNAYIRAKVNRIKGSGMGAASFTDPAIYGPPLPGQKPKDCAIKSDQRKYERRGAVFKLPLNKPDRKPVSSVWELGAL